MFTKYLDWRIGMSEGNGLHDPAVMIRKCIDIYAEYANRPASFHKYSYIRKSHEPEDKIYNSRFARIIGVAYKPGISWYSCL
jgi:hypothetical protein